MLATVVAQSHVVWRIQEGHGGSLVGQQTCQVVGRCGVPAGDDVVTQVPHIPDARARLTCGCVERALEIEGLRTLALLPRVEAAEEIADLILAEAAQ